LAEVIIYKLEEGIFFAKLVCQSDDNAVEIDSRTSDALALAVRFGCKIYTYENILDAAGLYLDNPETPQTQATGERNEKSSIKSNSFDSDLKSMSLEDLHNLLQQVLEQEDYVRAITIRDEINSRENNL
jgi:bifunctional DNase/RNase